MKLVNQINHAIAQLNDLRQTAEAFAKVRRECRRAMNSNDIEDDRAFNRLEDAVEDISDLQFGIETVCDDISAMHRQAHRVAKAVPSARAVIAQVKKES